MVMEIVDFPIKNGSFHSFVYAYQMVLFLYPFIELDDGKIYSKPRHL